MLDFNELCSALGGQVVVADHSYDDYRVYESDTRKDLSEGIFFAFKGENFDGHDYLDLAIEKGARVLIVSRPVELLSQESVGIIEVNDTVEAWQNLGTYLLQKQKKLIRFGVTGSSGKTSTNSILKSLLQVIAPGKVLSTAGNTNNHIGVPQNIVRLKGDERCAALEMGTNHPGEIAVLAKIVQAHGAILTTVGASHIGNFSGEEAILEEKLDIFRYMDKGGVAVLPENLKDEALKRLGRDDLKLLSFGCEDTADVCLKSFEMNEQGSRFCIDLMGEDLTLETSLSGVHQLLNICACLALLKNFEEELGFKISDLSEALKHLELPGMRMNIEEHGGVRYVLDCYNANPQSMAAFLDWSEAVYDAGWLVLGDMLELGETSAKYHSEVLSKAESMKGFKVITVGPEFQVVNKSERAFVNTDEAGDFLKSQIKSGDALFFKASRGIQLEKIYQELKA